MNNNRNKEYAVSIQKLEIITKSNERFLFSLVKPADEAIKTGCIVIGLHAIDDVPAYKLACGIPLKPGDAGVKMFKGVVQAIKDTGLECTVVVQD